MKQPGATDRMIGFLPSRWVLGALLCLGAFIACADAQNPEHSVDSGTKSLQKDLQQINRQLGQLQRTTAQATQTQRGQSDAVRQQISGIELSQQGLNTQLQTLQGQSLQQLDDLKAANRQLHAGLWTLSGIVALLLLVLWRLRKKKPYSHRLSTAASSPATPNTPSLAEPKQAPAQPATATAPDVTSVPEHTPEHESAPQSEHEHAPSPAHAPEPPPPPAAPWSALVAADLHSTEQAFAQAREGFMQPARTDF